MFLIALMVVAKASAAPTYPLKPSANNHYVVDANGAPFLIMGDAPHYMIRYISDSDKSFYLQNRGTNGFNSVQIELLCGWGNANNIDKGDDYYGNHPFTGLLVDGSNYDLTTPNPTYWAKVDWILQTAATNGLQGLLVPLDEGGYDPAAGYSGIAAANGSNNCYTYGQFLGNRYKNYTNIIWEMGNDFFLWTNFVYDSAILGIANGIKSVDSNHMMTIELTQPGDSLVDTNWNGVVNLNSIYDVSATYGQTLISYQRTNYLPVLFLEGRYESDGTPAMPTNLLRAEVYYATFAGAIAGYVYGNGYIWPFKTGWQTNLNTIPVQQMQYWQNLMTNRAWYNLVPNSNQVVTAGYGTWNPNQDVDLFNTYVTVAKTPDRTIALAYCPSNTTLTVVMTNFNGSVTSRWFDPSANTFTAIAGSPFANTITTNLTTPGVNAGGDHDWVLLLEDQPPQLIPPQITAAAFNGNNFVVSFSTLLGQKYELQNTTVPGSGSWLSVVTNIPGTGGIVQAADTNAASQFPRFYRVKTTL